MGLFRGPAGSPFGAQLEVACKTRRFSELAVDPEIRSSSLRLADWLIVLESSWRRELNGIGSIA
jgi:hypothetical protein